MNNSKQHRIIEISVDDARHGCTRQIMAGNNSIDVYIPKESKTGDIIEIRSGKGDLICTIEIKIAGEKTSKERKNITKPYRIIDIFSNLNKYKRYFAIGSIAVVAGLLFFLNYHVYDPPTCTEPSACKICGKVIAPATGHDWDDGEITTEATCEEAGIITYTCQNNPNHTKEETIPATGHDWVAATYDTPETCRRCGKTRGDKKENEYGLIIGESYTVQTNLRVRAGPGKEYRILERSELTDQDYAISVNSKTTKDALIEKGKKVTCQGMEGNWMKISSGWICVYDEGEELVK